MLDLMRRHAYSWAVRVILGLIVVVFAFWGIGTGFFNQVRPVANVDGHKILADDLNREADTLRRSYIQAYGPSAADFIKNLNLQQQALQELVENYLVTREAHRLGLQITDEQLQQAIATNPAFAIGGQFDVQTYEEVLRANGFEPAQFESSMRSDMLVDLVRRMIYRGVNISDAEARQEFNQRHQNISLAYVEVPYSEFTAQINPTAQELEKYYKSNGEKFREPDRVSVDYVRYDPNILGSKVNPSDKEIEAYYKSNLNSKFAHPQEVHARHILIAVSRDASPAEKTQARNKAQQVLDQLKHGADFSKLAAQYSDDTGNAKNGGDLGFFKAGQMVKPFEAAAFALKPGQLSGVVETPFGFHIIRVDEIRPAHTDTLEQARPSIIDELRLEAGRRMARRNLNEDLAAALAGTPLNDLAAKRNLTVVDTGPFAFDEPIKGLGVNREFARAAFKLGVGDTGAITGKDIDSYLVKVSSRNASHIPKLSEITERVKTRYIGERAEEKANQRAQALLAKVKHPADLDKIASAEKLDVRQTGVFDRSESLVPTVGDFPEVTSAAGAVAQVPGVLPRVFEHAGNSYIFMLEARTLPAEEEWTKQKAGFEAGLLESMRGRAWSSFLDDLKRQAKITVDARALGVGTTENSM